MNNIFKTTNWSIILVNPDRWAPDSEAESSSESFPPYFGVLLASNCCLFLHEVKQVLNLSSGAVVCCRSRNGSRRRRWLKPRRQIARAADCARWGVPNRIRISGSEAERDCIAHQRQQRYFVCTEGDQSWKCAGSPPRYLRTMTNGSIGEMKRIKTHQWKMNKLKLN